MSAASPPRGKTPRILHFIAGLDAGGVQVGMANLIERTAHLFEHTVCCLGAHGSVEDRLVSQGVPVHFLRRKDRHEWTLFLRIAALCRRLRPDLVHTRNWSTFEAVPGARLARVPALVHTEHTWLTNGGWQTFRRRRAQRLLLPLIDSFMVVSDEVRRNIHRDLGIPAEDITLVRNGVDTEVFKPAPNRGRRRAERGYTDEEIVIGTVGRAAHVKNWSALLEAFAVLRRRQSEVRLALVGGGPEQAGFEREARDLGIVESVRFVGHSDEVREWLTSMDVFALPSRSEAASIALLEAMAMGLPVVATDVGGTSQILADGITGRLVRAGDIPSLAEAIGAYCADEHLRIAHGSAGRRRIEEHFSIDRTTAGYVDVYRRTLRGR